MIKKAVLTLLLLTLGIVLIPSVTYACGKHHKKAVKTETSKPVTKSITKDACKKNPCHNSESQENHGCGPNCNHANCKCVHFTVTIALLHANGLEKTIANFSSLKQNAPDTGLNLSSGFHSIWQPPKIG